MARQRVEKRHTAWRNRMLKSGWVYAIIFATSVLLYRPHMFQITKMRPLQGYGRLTAIREFVPVTDRACSHLASLVPSNGASFKVQCC
jgi:hypothetical protein